MQLSLVEVGSAWHQDVLVEADPESSTCDVVSALGALKPGVLHLDGRPLSDQVRLADSGLRDGAVVEVGPAPVSVTPIGGTDAPWEVAVVSGSEAGARTPITADALTIGRDPTVDVRLQDTSVSRLHARMWWRTGEDSGWLVEDLASANGTWIDGQRIDIPTLVTPGAAIEIGASVLEVRPTMAADADVQPAEDGSLKFNRPPRLQPAPRRPRVQVPSAPAEQEAFPFPWIQALAPLAMGGVLYAVTRQVATLAFIVLSPVLVLSNTLTQRRRVRRKTLRDRERYQARILEARSAVTSAASEERSGERARWPDPATTAAVVDGPGRRLWERRDHDTDSLVLRVGVTDRPASVEVVGGDPGIPPDQQAVRVPTLYAVPVTVDLKSAGVVGVAGEVSSVRALGRWFVAQLAAWHTPRVLELYLLAPGNAEAEWDWVRWLPHTRCDLPGTAPVRLGNDDASRQERVRELLALLEARSSTGRDASLTPAVVVVIDGIRAVRAQPGVPRLLREGPKWGIFTIGLDHDSSRLAEEGRAEIAFESENGIATVRVDGHAPVEGVLVDQVSPEWADRLGRGLAPIRGRGRRGGRFAHTFIGALRGRGRR